MVPGTDYNSPPNFDIKIGQAKAQGSNIDQMGDDFDMEDIGSVLDHSFDDIVEHETTKFNKSRVSVALSWENIVIKAVPPAGKCGKKPVTPLESKIILNDVSGCVLPG